MERDCRREASGVGSWRQADARRGLRGRHRSRGGRKRVSLQVLVSRRYGGRPKRRGGRCCGELRILPRQLVRGAAGSSGMRARHRGTYANRTATDTVAFASASGAAALPSTSQPPASAWASGATRQPFRSGVPRDASHPADAAQRIRSGVQAEVDVLGHVSDHD